MLSTAKTGHGCSSPSRSMVPRNPRFIVRTNQASSCATACLGLRRKEQSTGISVSDTRNEASILTIVAIAIGVNNFPSTPDSPSNGTKTRTIKMVA